MRREVVVMAVRGRATEGEGSIVTIHHTSVSGGERGSRGDLKVGRKNHTIISDPHHLYRLFEHWIPSTQQYSTLCGYNTAYHLLKRNS
jgi:RecA-family ATPase